MNEKKWRWALILFSILFDILFKSNNSSKKRHMPNHRAHKDCVCMCQCYFFYCSWLLLLPLLLLLLLLSFVWFNALLWRFGFRFCHRKLNSKPNWFNCVLRMRNAKTDSFSVFSPHHLTFAKCMYVCVYFICRLDCRRFCLFLFFAYVCDCVSVMCVSVYEFWCCLALFLFASKNRCVQIDRRQFAWTHLQNFCWHEYNSVFVTLSFIVLFHIFTIALSIAVAFLFSLFLSLSLSLALTFC